MKSYQVNEPQAKAILGSLKTHGFSLIQGCALSGPRGLYLARAYLSSADQTARNRQDQDDPRPHRRLRRLAPARRDRYHGGQADARRRDGASRQGAPLRAE